MAGGTTSRPFWPITNNGSGMARKFERFKEIKVIGAGAFGKTLLVEDLTQANRRVVIKVPLTEETETPLITHLINNPLLQNSLKVISHPHIIHHMRFPN